MNPYVPEMCLICDEYDECPYDHDTGWCAAEKRAMRDDDERDRRLDK